MMNLKGIVVGSLLFVAVEIILLVRSFPPRPAGMTGTIGIDVLTTLRGLGHPMFWITLIILISICSEFFQK